MRRLCVLLALTSFLVAVPSAAAATRRCRPAPRDVIARSGSNVVFIRARPGGEYPGPVTVYGCYSVRHSPRRLLDFPDDSSGEFLKLGPAGHRARSRGTSPRSRSPSTTGPASTTRCRLTARRSSRRPTTCAPGAAAR